MYRTALVALKPGSANDVASRYALGLAQQTGIRLSGLAVVDADRLVPAEAVPLGGAAFKAKKDEVLVQKARQAAADMVQGFLDRGKAAGVACEGQVSEGDLVTLMTTAVQRTDLLVLGHRVGQTIGDAATGGSVLHDLLKQCPRPAIVVPACSAATQHVLVAYDGSLQAARAVQAFATSGLSASHRVHVLSIQDDPAAAEAVAGPAVEYLRSHGFTVEGHPESLRKSLASQILDATRHTQAALLVMGAYGKLSLQEFLFGSVTRAILSTIDIPVLLDH